MEPVRPRRTTARRSPAGRHALATRGLPGDAYEVFLRSPERELTVAELPGAGPAAFMADYTDQDNSYWLSLADGAIWMRWGTPDEPAGHTQRINTTVEGLQGALAAWCDLQDTGLDENDGEDYEQAVNITVIHAVKSDPTVFTDDEGWWPNFFFELEFTLPRTLAGDAYLYQLVHQDEAGAWVLDHPGRDDED